MPVDRSVQNSNQMGQIESSAILFRNIVCPYTNGISIDTK